MDMNTIGNALAVYKSKPKIRQEKVAFSELDELVCGTISELADAGDYRDDRGYSRLMHDAKVFLLRSCKVLIVAEIEAALTKWQDTNASLVDYE